jgi:plastocyanin
MTQRITPTIIVCAAGAAVTVGGLFSTASSPRPASVVLAVPAPPAGNGDAPATAQLTIEGFAFNAASVAPGATVQVTNLNSAAHTLSGDAFDVAVDPNGTASFVAPAVPGTYSYFCFIHPSMSGELVVS